MEAKGLFSKSLIHQRKEIYMSKKKKATCHSKLVKPKAAAGMLLPIKILENYKKQIADAMPLLRNQSHLDRLQYESDFAECMNRIKIIDEAVKIIKRCNIN